MYTINITPNNQQKCLHCRNSFLQFIGTQAWCTGCNRAVTTIEQETKVVPKMYQSNCKDKISSTELKIKAYLNEFCNKYGGVNDVEEIDFLYRQVLDIKVKKGMGSKNYRQNAAVIVYVHFRDCHRQSIKEFCKKNQIEQKSFNKSYLTYQKLIKQKKMNQFIRESKSQDCNLKEQDQLKLESNEDSVWQKESLNGVEGRCSREETAKRYFGELNAPQESSARLPIAKDEHFDRPLCENTIEQLLLNSKHLQSQVRAFLHSVFDSFFHSLIYAEKRNLLVEELSEQILQTYQTLKLLFQSSGSAFYVSLEGLISDDNFHKYLFYIVLRKVAYGVSQVKYKKVIQEATGESIRATLLKSVIKALDLQEETASTFSGDSVFFVENSGTTGSEFVKLEEKE